MNLKEKGWRGLPLDDTLVIDAHCHYMNPWISDIGEYIRKMDLVGVDKMCMTFSSGELDKTEKFRKAYPNRILAYQWYDPPIKGEEAEVGNWVDKQGFIGYKIHPNVGCSPNKEGYVPVWEAADRKKAVVLCHTWYPSAYCDPAMFMEAAERYPSAQIILGHCGGSLDGMILSVEATNKYENIYMELDNAAHHYKELEYLVKHVDISKILFGSDFSTEDFATHLGPILFADIKEEDKEKILGLNMKEMLTRINRYY